MALGTYGIVRPADVSPDDVDIILHYTASRDVTDNFLLNSVAGNLRLYNPPNSSTFALPPVSELWK